MRPLSFCFLTTFYPPYNFGGDGIGIQRLARGLVRRGHRVTVVHDKDSWRLLSGRDDPPPAAEPEGLEVVSLESRLGKLAPFLTQQTGRPIAHKKRLQRVLDEGAFDVLVYNNVSLLGGPGLFPMGDAIKLYLAHEHWLVCPSHVLWRHGRERCTERQCLRCVLSYRRPPQLWRYTGLLERNLDEIDTFVAMSEFSREKHKEFGFPREMEVLPYFLPDPEPGPESEQGAAEAGPPHPRPYFLFVGRLEKIKGLDDVIPLFREFEEADLLVAGDGEYGEVLRALGAGLERVHFLGRVAQEELARYYRHARALIVPSVCFETFGIILIEAFQRETPVIARRLGPFPEIVERAGGGELFEDEAELLAAMRRLASDDEHRAALARSGYRAYLEYWSDRAVVPAFLDLVRQAAERRDRRAVVEALT